MCATNIMRVTIILISLAFGAWAQKNPNHWPNRNGIVHLFEWKWNNIAVECESFLAPHGYAGVQISPPTENVIIVGRPWWERYQPISYKFETRSGTETQLDDMIGRCNAVGIRIYADVVINHMAHGSNIGIGGSRGDSNSLNYSAVPYSALDFNADCSIQSYNDPIQVRNCRLQGMPDLNQGVEWVRARTVDMMNRLIDKGVAGFRVDAVKHMWPGDLENIYSRLNNLNKSHGFINGARPFIIQEVIDLGNEAIKADEYTHLGTVTEFKFSAGIGSAFRGEIPLSRLFNMGLPWGFLPSNDALTFIDNHDNQRGHGAGGANILTYKDPRLYKMANAFMLALPYGTVRIMSSFVFKDSDQGPPAGGDGNIKAPTINTDGSCGGGWVCEHRWRQIYNMIEFRNTVANSNVTYWWSNEANQIAFCRGAKGFVAFNNEATNLLHPLRTCLPPGTYCDVISGSKSRESCTGTSVVVGANGIATINIASNATEGVLAIHIGAKL